MIEYNKTLPFDADIYNPIYRKSYMVSSAIHDYLSSIGFVTEHSNLDMFYVLKDLYGQTLCSLNISIPNEDDMCGTIRRFIPNTEKWTETEFNDLDSAIGACNTIIATYCTCINSATINVLDKLTSSRVSNILDKRFDVNTLTTYTEDAKKKTIEYLEKQLRELKG